MEGIGRADRASAAVQAGRADRRDRHRAAEAVFLRAINDGEVGRVEMVERDWLRAVELIETYADMGLGLVDASVIAAAERLGLTTIATLDRRHFAVVRPAHTTAFELVP